MYLAHIHHKQLYIILGFLLLVNEQREKLNEILSFAQEKILKAEFMRKEIE